jgi:hypothetical protein
MAEKIEIQDQEEIGLCHFLMNYEPFLLILFSQGHSSLRAVTWLLHEQKTSNRKDTSSYRCGNGDIWNTSKTRSVEFPEARSTISQMMLPEELGLPYNVA